MSSHPDFLLRDRNIKRVLVNLPHKIQGSGLVLTPVCRRRMDTAWKRGTFLPCGGQKFVIFRKQNETPVFLAFSILGICRGGSGRLVGFATEGPDF